jgi:glucose-1-phosphatase
MIETVLFDLGNVLFPFDWNRAIQKFGEKLGRDPVALKASFSSPDYSILFYEFGTGRISVPRFYAGMNELLSSCLTGEEIRHPWCSIFTEDREMTGLLKALSLKYRVFIVSDTDTLHWEYLDGLHGLEALIRGAILSFRRGMMKTDKGCFEGIIKDYRLDPANTVFIDDLEKNTKAAESAGVKGIIHRTHESTVQELRAMGVF